MKELKRFHVTGDDERSYIVVKLEHEVTHQPMGQSRNIRRAGRVEYKLTDGRDVTTKDEKTFDLIQQDLTLRLNE